MNGERVRQPLERLERAFRDLARARRDFRPGLELEQVGEITSVGPGVVETRGLDSVRFEEVLRLGRDHWGLAVDLERHRLGVVLLDEGRSLAAGDPVRRTGGVLTVPVGDGLLGRVVDPRGRPLDGRGAVRAEAELPVERPAPAIMDRAPVTEPLQTGLKVVDAMIPVGKGQRELILGDRQTGKTTVALDTVLNQAGREVVCIYCGVGKRSAALAEIIAKLGEARAMEYSLVVAATEEDPPGLQYVAPYAATSMGEHFMAKGRDVLIVYDDLTRHARAYREMSLLLRRPPGREAYPGDIFYIHSRLLERSTHLREELGGGSLTALPIIETEAQNLAGYIPTNLISITDGQIYLSPDLFQKGLLPAVDVGRSVSRVGGKTQLRSYRAVAGDLRLAYSQFQELESFSRFGTRLDEATKKTLERGRRVREVLKQPQGRPLSVCQQIAVLTAVNRGVFDVLELADVTVAETLVCERVPGQAEELCRAVELGEPLDEDQQERLTDLARRAVAELAGSGGHEDP